MKQENKIRLAQLHASTEVSKFTAKMTRT